MSVIIQQYLEKITVAVEDVTEDIIVVISAPVFESTGLESIILNGTISGFWLGTQDEYTNVLPQQYKDDPKFVTLIREE